LDELRKEPEGNPVMERLFGDGKLMRDGDLIIKIGEIGIRFKNHDIFGYMMLRPHCNLIYYKHLQTLVSKGDHPQVT